jgi:hypothetical protein
VRYPVCDYAYFVVGNWTLNTTSNAYLRRFLVNDGMRAISWDVNRYIANNLSSSCGSLKNISAFTLRVVETPSANYLEMDVEFSDQDRIAVGNVSACVIDALINRPPPLPNATALLRLLFPEAPTAIVSISNFTFIGSNTNPCEPDQCRDAAAPMDDVIAPKPFPWWIIVAAVGGAILAGAVAAFVVMKQRTPAFNRRKILRERDLKDGEAFLVSSELEAQAISGGQAKSATPPNLAETAQSRGHTRYLARASPPPGPIAKGSPSATGGQSNDTVKKRLVAIQANDI